MRTDDDQGPHTLTTPVASVLPLLVFSPSFVVKIRVTCRLLPCSPRTRTVYITIATVIVAVQFQFVAHRRKRVRRHARWQFQNRVSQNAERDPPPRHLWPYFQHFARLAKEQDVNRK